MSTRRDRLTELPPGRGSVIKKEIAERAENVTFSMKAGLLRKSVFIGYFDEVY